MKIKPFRTLEELYDSQEDPTAAYEACITNGTIKEKNDLQDQWRLYFQMKQQAKEETNFDFEFDDLKDHIQRLKTK